MSPYTSALLGGGDGEGGSAAEGDDGGGGGAAAPAGGALLGARVFRNAAAALRVGEESSDNFLDRTRIHPEYYMCAAYPVYPPWVPTRVYPSRCQCCRDISRESIGAATPSLGQTHPHKPNPK